MSAASASARSATQEVYATRARTAKACALADSLLAHGCRDSDTVRALTAPDRRAIEAAAGVREASDLTWETVAVLVDHATRSAGGPVPLDLY